MSRLNIFFAILLTLSNWSFQAENNLKYLDYSDIIHKIEELSRKHPQLLKITYAQEKFSGIANRKCEFKKESSEKAQYIACKYPIIELTNFAKPAEVISGLPQSLVVAGVNGKEIQGPSAMIAWLEYILKNKEENQILFNSMMIILVPFINPVGLTNKESGEFSYEINTDFPLDSLTDFCFSTSGARVLNEIYRNYLISSSLIFGGFKNTENFISKIIFYIGYPFGNNHFSEKISNADSLAFNSFSKVLKEAGFVKNKEIAAISIKTGEEAFGKVFFELFRILKGIFWIGALEAATGTIITKFANQEMIL